MRDREGQPIAFPLSDIIVARLRSFTLSASSRSIARARKTSSATQAGRKLSGLPRPGGNDLRQRKKHFD
jgi:hypothetical protein